MISIHKDFDNPPKDLLGSNPRITEAVKRELWELYNGKCAYTEEKLQFHEIQITRYRPQSLYPELAFEWSNLLPVSNSTNASLSNNFQISGKHVDKELLKKSENRKANSACLLAERPYLLHPEIDTPENYYHYSNTSSHIISGEKRGHYTIQVLNLNSPSLLAIREKTMQYAKDLFSSSARLFLNNPKIGFLRKTSEWVQLDKVIAYLNQKESSFFTFRQHILTQITNNYSYFLNKELSDQFIYQSPIEKEFKLLIHQLIQLKQHSTNYFFSEQNIIAEKDSSENIKETQLPFSLKGFEISKLAQIQHTQITNIPLNTRWVFLTGENGFGKTLVLQAIVQALWGYAHENNYVPRIILELHSNQRNSFYHTYHNVYDHQLYYWCAYGANRTKISGNINFDTQTPQKVNKTDSLFKGVGVLSNIEAYFIAIEGKEQFKQKGDNIKQVLLELLPSIDDFFVDTSQEQSRIFYREKSEDGSSMPPIPFYALSSGNKSIIAMIGDMILDLSENQGFTHPSELQGIVIIDEIDIHLHPKWQKRFIQTLTHLFPKIQFIASTHSAIPLLGAPKETILLNVEKPSKKEGIKIRKLDIDITKLTPNTILSSPIFGFDAIDSVESERRNYTQTNYDDVLFEQELKNRLKKLADDDDLSKYIIGGSSND